MIDPFAPVTKTVVLLGMAKTTRGMAPFDDDHEIWILNEMLNVGAMQYGWIKKWDRVFQIHQSVDYTRADNFNDPQHFAALQMDWDRPIYMFEPTDNIPCAVKYPLDEILDRFCKNYLRGDENKMIKYLTSTPSYMIAMAAYLGAPRIECYGFEMQSDTEYSYQRDGWTFWAGIAGQYGEVWMPEKSGLLRGPLYGIESARNVHIDQFRERMGALQALHDEFENTLTSLRDKLDELEYTAKNADKRNKPLLAKLSAEYEQAREDILRHGQLMNMNAGAIQANRHWIDEAAKISDDGWVIRQHIEIYNQAMNNALEKIKGEANQANGLVIQLQRESRKKSLKKNEKNRLQKAIDKASTDRDDLHARFWFFSGSVRENKTWLMFTDQRITWSDMLDPKWKKPKSVDDSEEVEQEWKTTESMEI